MQTNKVSVDETRKAELTRAKNDLMQAVASLREAVREIGRRLEPVMREPGPCGTAKSNVSDCPRPQKYWSQLDDLTTDIGGVQSELVDYLDRLEV
jgi:hypothetical protein